VARLAVLAGTWPGMIRLPSGWWTLTYDPPVSVRVSLNAYGEPE